MATKAQQAEQTEALNKLHEWIKAGDTVSCVLRHVSRSGMQRSISLVINLDGQPTDISYFAARALGYRIDQTNGGAKIGGCGMDMGFALVYNLSSVMFRGGFGCIGRGCPSNDHSNGDYDFTIQNDGIANVHWHKDGGYALNYRWL